MRKIMNTTKIKNAESGSSLILALVLIFAVFAGAAIVYSSTKINAFRSGEIVCNSAIAPEITQKKSDGNTGALVISSVSAPILPEIELSPFYQHAYKNGQVKKGHFSVPSGYVPVGGILWCDGTLDFKGKATGCFIATAGITLEAGAEVKPINPNWPTIYKWMIMILLQCIILILLIALTRKILLQKD
jgi:hypothetical protein